MDIKPETVKKLAYPALAVVAAAALSACDPETPPEDIDQGIPGEPPPVYSDRYPQTVANPLLSIAAGYSRKNNGAYGNQT